MITPETAVTLREDRDVQSLTPEAERFKIEQRMARLFVTSGLFRDIAGTTPEQAIAQAWVKIALGSSMGFSPAESMQGIDIIQGRPSVGAQLRAARMQRAGYSWKIEQLDNKGCRLRIFCGEQDLGEAIFMEEDARNGGLLSKENWKKDPTSMYFARAITRAQRRFAPGVLSLDVVSSEEAIDIGPPEPDRPNIAMATDRKTEDLAKRLSVRRASGERPANAIDVQTQPAPAAVPSGERPAERPEEDMF